MSAERRRHDDSLPSDEWATDPQGWTAGTQGRHGSDDAGPAWSDEFHHDAGPRGGGRTDWPGDAPLDQDWADSYRFDGRRSDEPWRDPAQRDDSSPADQAWRHDDAADDGSGDDWIDRTQVDQSWRYRSLADDQLADEVRNDAGRADTGRADAGRADEGWAARDLADGHRESGRAGDDWPGLDPAAEAGRGPGETAGRRASDSWPAGHRADDSWRESSPAGQSYAIDPHAVDPFAADGLAVDPFATDLYAGDYASGSRPSGTHVIGGRRASDSWLTGTHADESIPAAGGPARDGLAAGEQLRISGRTATGEQPSISGRTATGEQPSISGRDGSGQGDGGRTGRRRAGRGEADGTRLDGTQLGAPQPGGNGPGDWDGGDWGDGRRPGGRRRILVSVLAAVAVALAFAAYGLVRMHDQSTLALQGSSSRPCGTHAGRCHSHPPRTPGPASSSPLVSDSGGPGSSVSPTTGASGTPSTAPSSTAPPASMPASVAPPPHSAPPPPPAPKPTPKPSASASQGTGTASSAAAAQVLAVINQARAQQGLPALTVSSGLNASSAAHTSVMAGDCGLSHQCPGEPPLGTRISNAGVQWTSAGENIGEGGPVGNNTTAITQMAVNLTQSMLNERPPDDGHRMNILSSSFRFTGITVFIDSKGTVWMTQDFSG
jgi:uncharacterized protein YkwD